MLGNAEFWVGVAFVIFLGLAWRMGVFRTMLDGLDARGKRIRAELDESHRLRAEAETLLADFTRRRAEAETEAAALVAGAREEAERLSREAHDRAADFVRRRTAAAELKISQAEAQATQQVRDAAAEAAIRMSESILRSQSQGEAAQDLIRRSLGEVRSRLHA